jgi:hypothetical protein
VSRERIADRRDNSRTFAAVAPPDAPGFDDIFWTNGHAFQCIVAVAVKNRKCLGALKLLAYG